MGLLRGIISGLAVAIGLVFILPAQAEAPELEITEIAQFSPQGYAESLMISHGWEPEDLACLIQLWTKESHWNYKADNPTSTAYGIAQLLGETSKDPARQIRQGLKYIESRYENPCTAWQFWKSHYWY